MTAKTALKASTPTRSQATAEAIRAMILSGEIERGEWLRAQVLADRLGVSRTPVSEALGFLYKEGLLEYRVHRGYRVKTFDADLLLGAFDVRLTLEGLACRLIAERGMSHATAILVRDNLARTEDILFNHEWTPETRERWRLANLEFHDALLTEAANPYLTEGVLRTRQLPPILNSAKEPIDTNELFPRLDRTFSQQAFRDHARVAEAIEAGQGARAEAMMKEHIFTTREAARRILTLMVS
ncbi:GntR family transcriptional regulator [Sphingomonas oligophenolica]|uniref:GntR family transcriptional regulator n=1 Tax=Sphingomonas oligophenolica TaxID=301154 RepID=A0ABU9Y8R3_9SPHN